MEIGYKCPKNTLFICVSTGHSPFLSIVTLNQLDNLHSVEILTTNFWPYFSSIFIIIHRRSEKWKRTYKRNIRLDQHSLYAMTVRAFMEKYPKTEVDATILFLINGYNLLHAWKFRACFTAEENRTINRTNVWNEQHEKKDEERTAAAANERNVINLWTLIRRSSTANETISRFRCRCR